MSKIKAERPDYVFYCSLTGTYEETGAKPAVVSVTKLDEDKIRKEFDSRHSIDIRKFRHLYGYNFDAYIDGDCRSKGGTWSDSEGWEKGEVWRVHNKPIVVTVVSFDNYKRFFFATTSLRGTLYQIRMSDADIMRLIANAGIAKGGEVLAPVLWESDRGRLRLSPATTQ